MKLAIILGLVSLTVFPKEGLCKRIHQKLNLTEVAEKYLGERFGENLESWSLTEVPRLPEEPAVKGTVQPFQYDANITALYKSKEHTFQFNLSDASSATWNPENLTEPINFTAAVMKWECEFRAEVDFKGWLAYTLRVVRGDTPKSDTLPIGLLANEEMGLLKYGTDGLNYTISGTYQHLLVCEPEQDRRKKDVKKVPKSICETLNLSEVAEQYIEKSYPGRVASWSLTGGYRLKYEHPVQGKIQEFEYQKECEHANSSLPPKCIDSYTFLFNKSILTPFVLKANISVFYNGTLQTFSSNLSSDASMITLNPKTVKDPNKYKNKSLQADLWDARTPTTQHV
ncbi:hypothetical protein MTO96_003304 [Rhipicephalus appendiculatus]